MTAFENFVSEELPKRTTLLTDANTGYTGNPNLAVNAAINGAPQGTLFIDNTGPRYVVYVKQIQAVPTSWAEMGSSANIQSSDVAASIYNFTLSDIGIRKRFLYPSLTSAIIAPESEIPWPVGSIIYGMQYDDGRVAILEGPGVTVRTPNLTFVPQTLEKNSQFALYYEGSDVWTLGGLLAPVGTPAAPPIQTLYGGSGWDGTNRLRGTAGEGVAGNSGMVWVAVLFSINAVPALIGGSSWLATYFNGAGTGWALEVGSNRNIRLNNILGGLSPAYTLSASDVDKYQMVVAQYDGVRLRLYMGRVEVGAGTVAGYSATTGSQQFSIGTSATAPEFLPPEFTVYGVAAGDAGLTLGEVQTLFDDVKVAGDMVVIPGKTDALYSVTQDKVDAFFPDGLLDKVGSANLTFDAGTRLGIDLETRVGFPFGW